MQKPSRSLFKDGEWHENAVSHHEQDRRDTRATGSEIGEPDGNHAESRSPQ